MKLNDNQKTVLKFLIEVAQENGGPIDRHLVFLRINQNKPKMYKISKIELLDIELGLRKEGFLRYAWEAPAEVPTSKAVEWYKSNHNSKFQPTWKTK